MQTTLTAAEIAERGRAIYEREIRAKVEEPANKGKILVLDIDSGDYEIDEDHLTASDRACAKHPDGVFFGLRIGYPALGKIGGSWGELET